MNTDVSKISSSADFVLGFGNPPRRLIAFEFQVSADAFLYLDVLLRNVLLFYQQAKAHPELEKIDVISIVILLKKGANHPTLSGKILQGQLSPEDKIRLSFEYELIELFEIPVDEILEEGAELSPLAVLGKLEEWKTKEEYHKKLEGVLLKIIKLVSAKIPNESERKELFETSIVLMNLRCEKENTRKIFEGVRDQMQTMDTSIVQEILSLWTDEDTQKIIKRFEKEIKAKEEDLKAKEEDLKAKEEDLKAKDDVLKAKDDVLKANQDALAKRVARSRENILTMGRKTLGEPSNQIVDHLNQINDFDTLDDILCKVIDASSWEQLVGLSHS